MSDLTIGLSLFAFLMLSYWLVRVLGGDAARSVARPHGRRNDHRDGYRSTEATTVARGQPDSEHVSERVTERAAPSERGHTTVSQVEQAGRVVAETRASGPRAPIEPQPIVQPAAAKPVWQEPTNPTVQSSLVNVERPHPTPLATSEPLPASGPAAASAVTVSVTRDPERVSPSSLARGAAERDAAARAAMGVASAAAGSAAVAAASAQLSSDAQKPSAAATLPPNYVTPAAPDAARSFADAPTAALPPGFARASSDATLAPPSAPEKPKPVVACEPLPPLPVAAPRPLIEREPPRIDVPSVAQTLAPSNAALERPAEAPAQPHAGTELPNIASTLPPDYQRPPLPAAPKTYVVGPIDLPEAFLRADSRATLAPPRVPEPPKPITVYEYSPPLPDAKSRPGIERTPPTVVAPNVQHTVAANAPVAPAANAATLAAGGAAATATVRAAPDETPSRYAVRAQRLPRSEATTPRAPAGAEPPGGSAASEAVIPARAAPESAKPAVDPAYLVSLQRRGVRLIGPDVDPVAIDVLVPFVPRPQTPSIWSNAVPRRAPTDDEILASEIMAVPSGPSVKAERIAVRSEPLLVRPDVRQTVAPATSAPAQPAAKPAAQENLIGPLSLTPSSQMSSSVGTAGGFAIAQIRSADEPEKGERPNVNRTLPPGALGDE